MSVFLNLVYIIWKSWLLGFWKGWIWVCRKWSDLLKEFGSPELWYFILFDVGHILYFTFMHHIWKLLEDYV